MVPGYYAQRNDHGQCFLGKYVSFHDGISDTLNLQALMTRFNLDYNKHGHLKFGAYIQNHEENDNSMQSWMTGDIALWPTGNHQGWYYFMSLTSGHHLIHNRWTELPLPQDMIQCVNTLRCHSNAHHEDLAFAWLNGSPIIDLDDPDNDPLDPNYEPLDSNSDTDPDGNLSFVSDGDLTTAGVDDDANDANNNDADGPLEQPNINDTMGPPPEQPIVVGHLNNP